MYKTDSPALHGDEPRNSERGHTSMRCAPLGLRLLGITGLTVTGAHQITP